MAEPRYSMIEPMPPPVPILPMTARMMSLADHPARELALDRDRHRPWPSLRQTLGGEHVLDLAGADSKREGAEGAVGRGVAVAADDGHAGLGQAKLRPDDVDDALAGIAHRVELDPELLAVAGQVGELGGRDRVRDRQVYPDRRHVVVRRGNGQVRAADFAPCHPQPLECLRRGHLVDQVEVDEKGVGLARRRMNDVPLPDLVAQGGWTFGLRGCFKLASSWAGERSPRVWAIPSILAGGAREGYGGEGRALHRRRLFVGTALEAAR